MAPSSEAPFLRSASTSSSPPKCHSTRLRCSALLKLPSTVRRPARIHRLGVRKPPCDRSGSRLEPPLRRVCLRTRPVRSLDSCALLPQNNNSTTEKQPKTLLLLLQRRRAIVLRSCRLGSRPTLFAHPTTCRCRHSERDRSPRRKRSRVSSTPPRPRGIPRRRRRIGTRASCPGRRYRSIGRRRPSFGARRWERLLLPFRIDGGIRYSSSRGIPAAVVGGKARRRRDRRA